MEKEPQPDSLSEVTVNKYAPSEVYSTEPPPAYHRPQSSSVQIARIAALTVVAVSLVLGGFILAAAYVNANASCQQLQQELQLLQEASDRLQPLQPEALTQEDTQQPRRHHSTETHAEQKEEQSSDKEIEDNNISSQESSETEESSDEDDDRTPIHIKLPLQLDFDELAGALMEKNQRSRMNCIVEKKKAEEVVDHQAKTVRLPFGLNLTTDPRYERVIGERMAIFCESGDTDQRHVPQQQEETMMIQPIILPLSPPINLPPQYQHQMPPQQPQQNPQTLHFRPQIQQIQPQLRTTIIQLPSPQRAPMPAPPQAHQLPPHPLMQHIAQQIIAQHELAAQAHREQQAAQQQGEVARRHQEMAQRHQEIMRQQEMVQRQQMMHRQQEMAQREQEMAQRQQQEETHPHHMNIPEAVMMAHRIPIPEEILSEVNRLPNQNVVVSVSEHEAEEVPQEDIRVVQHQRESAQEINGRQSYARGLPVHIPVPMMQVQQQDEPARPHYVQPRSVRSVDSVLHREKRVKRCACDCAC